MGFFLAVIGPDWWQDFFFDHALGFLVSFWVGAGFAFMWWRLEASSGVFPGGRTGIALAGIVGVVLVAGISALTDPWFFGVAIWPGLALLLPSLEHRLAPKPEAAPQDD